MDPLIEFIKSLALSHRQGWILAIVGSVTLLFIRKQWWPLATGEVITAPIAGMCCLAGATIVIVDTVAAVKNRAATALKQRADHRIRAAAEKSHAEKRRAELEALNGRAVENIEILTPAETNQLIWILRNGQKRFTGSIGSLSRLDDLEILSKPEPPVDGVWVVNDAVWKIRQQFLERYRQRNIARSLEPISYYY